MPGPRTRICLFLGSCFLAGAVAASLVYIGDHLQWRSFSQRSGYFGTGFMDSYLYAIGSPYAMHIVAVMWFLYGATAAGMLGIIMTMVRRFVRR